MITTLLKSIAADDSEKLSLWFAATEVNAEVDKTIAVNAEANNVFTEVFIFSSF
ncbi:hypothetical protein D3C87_1396000 [compost metagenome]